LAVGGRRSAVGGKKLQNQHYILQIKKRTLSAD